MGGIRVDRNVFWDAVGHYDPSAIRRFGRLRLGRSLLIPHGCLVGRPITEIKQESVVRGRLKSKKIILRIQPFLRLPMFGVNGGFTPSKRAWNKSVFSLSGVLQVTEVDDLINRQWQGEIIEFLKSKPMRLKYFKKLIEDRNLPTASIYLSTLIQHHEFLATTFWVYKAHGPL
jgi:hypothetical protein